MIDKIIKTDWNYGLGSMPPKPGTLRVWWIPQVPMKPFYVPVITGTIREAKHILDILARYNMFQYKNKVKPDYSNAGGLQIYELDPDGGGKPGWVDWYDADGNGIDEVDHDGNLLMEG